MEGVMPKITPCINMLRSEMEYDQKTGHFKWLVNKGGKRSGNIAGCLRPDGYRAIKFDGKHYLAHRLAWFYVYESMPKKELDHIDGNRDNNKINNLREATSSQNKQNTKMSKQSKSGLKGAHYHKISKKWLSRIKVNKKTIHLGYFDTKEEAHEAYKSAANDMFKEFANYKNTT
jgi:hypothetical protein